MAILLSLRGLKPCGASDLTAAAFEGDDNATGVVFVSNLKKNSKKRTTMATRIFQGSRRRRGKTWRAGEYGFLW